MISPIIARRVTARDLLSSPKKEPPIVLDPDASAFISRAELADNTTYEKTRKLAINDLFITLKSSVALSKLDCLWVPKKAGGQGSGKLNLVKTAHGLTVPGASYWDTLGITSVAGVNNVINTNYIPSTDAVKFAVNNAGIGVYGSQLVTSPTVTNTTFVFGDGALMHLMGIKLNIYGNDETTRFNGCFLQGSNEQITGSTLTSDPYFFQLNRTASNLVTAYRNSISTGTQTSGRAGRALSTNSIKLLAISNTTAVSGLIKAAWIGEPLNSVEQAGLRDALNTYFSAL